MCSDRHVWLFITCPDNSRSLNYNTFVHGISKYCFYELYALKTNPPPLLKFLDLPLYCK